MNENTLIEAAKTGDCALLDSLIDEGADLEQRDEYGWTALNWAAGRGSTDMVEHLLKAGANILNTGRDQRTPYQIALAAARVDTAKCLQQAEREAGAVPEQAPRPYCKAYPIERLHAFPAWRENASVEDDAVVFLHGDLTVTTSMWQGENIVYADVTPEWEAFCSSALAFHVPTDLELAEEYAGNRPDAYGRT